MITAMTVPTSTGHIHVHDVDEEEEAAFTFISWLSTWMTHEVCMEKKASGACQISLALNGAVKSR